MADTRFNSFKFVSEPYDVVRTVGFRLSCLNGERKRDCFDMRLDIVKHADALLFAPRLWEVNPLSGCFQPCATRLPVELNRSTVEETIAATLEYLDGRGAESE
jgi:hypothetical protein